MPRRKASGFYTEGKGLDRTVHPTFNPTGLRISGKHSGNTPIMDARINQRATKAIPEGQERYGNKPFCTFVSREGKVFDIYPTKYGGYWERQRDYKGAYAAGATSSLTNTSIRGLVFAKKKGIINVVHGKIPKPIPKYPERVKSARETIKRLQKEGHPFTGLKPSHPDVKYMITSAKINLAYYEGRISEAEWNRKRVEHKIKHSKYTTKKPLPKQTTKVKVEKMVPREPWAVKKYEHWIDKLKKSGLRDPDNPSKTIPPSDPRTKREIKRLEIELAYSKGEITKAEFYKRHEAWAKSEMKKLTKKPSKRTQKLLKKIEERQKVLDSKDFELWWDARRKIKPIPADPYRAFLTDRGMKAKVEGIGPWKKQPNRRDTAVDWPRHRGEKPIPRKQRKRKPKRRKFPEKPQALPKTKELKELQAYADKMTDHYNVPRVKVVRTRGRRSRCHSDWQSIRGQYGKFEPRGITTIYLGQQPRKSLTESVLAHEIGHHVDNQSRFQEQGFLTQQEFGSTDKHSKLAREKRAWKVAEPFMKDKEEEAIRRWNKKYSLETYRRKAVMIVVRSGWAGKLEEEGKVEFRGPRI